MTRRILQLCRSVDGVRLDEILLLFAPHEVPAVTDALEAMVARGDLRREGGRYFVGDKAP